MSRFPFPIPYSWYQVAWSDELPVGGVRPLYYFATDLVLWRDDEGTAHLQDAICPHLGAHLGHGGHVEGCTLQCPFHGWRYDGEGTNVDIPYSSRTNGRAKLRTYPVVERNGLIMAWYHPDGVEPLFDIPEVPELNDDTRFTPQVHRSFDIPAAWQEIAENQVDVAHFRYVHNTDIVPEIAEYSTDGHMAYLRSEQKFPTPQGTVDGRIDVDTYCPGFGVVRFRGIVEDPALLGAMLAAVYALASLTQVVVGRLIDHVSLKPLYLCIVALQIPLLALAALTRGWWLLLALLGVMVVIFGAVPFTDAMVVRYVDDRMRSRVAGARMALSLGISSLAVWLLGPLVKVSSFGALFVGMALLAVCTLAVVSLLPSDSATA